MDLSLAQFAQQAGNHLLATISREDRKELGQFLTPPAIALFMARRAVAGMDREVVRILEPAAGAGILVAAVVEELIQQPNPPAHIDLKLFEFDLRFKPCLSGLVDRMRRAAKSRGVALTASISYEDFLLSSMARSAKPQFDVCISNPPYFKLNKSDERAVVHGYAVHGQPNIYGLFQAATADLLLPSGRWCFITPRSWMNGAYFASVRRHILKSLRFDAFHLFESRTEHFEGEEVLQEAVIAWATAQGAQIGDIAISTSQGSVDLPQAEVVATPARDVISQDEFRMIAMPIATGTKNVAFTDFSCTDTLASLGLAVSTGRVVPFRATEFVEQDRVRNSVPLLWMQHVTHSGVRWPIQKKREHLRNTAENAWMLVPNTNYVLLRRFSPKEDLRRVTAAAYLGNLPSPFLGLENHLNYIYRPGGELTRDETVGLAAFLSSRYFDAHFRSFSGNTQVNATELRRMPFPDLQTLRRMGAGLADRYSLDQADMAVEIAIGGARADGPQDAINCN